MKIKNIGIVGIGSYVPKKVITNEDIDTLNIGTNAAWTHKMLGMTQRHVVEDELPSDLGYEASIRAIEDAMMTKEDIDLIIVATSSPDRISPSTACLMAKKLDINVPAFDINAVCSGFVYGMQLATNLVGSGQYKNVLLVGAEAYSKITDWGVRNCVFFGDGAGAVIISNTDGGWISTDIYGNPHGQEAFTCHHSGKFHMNAGAVYDFATQVLPQTIETSLKSHDISINEINWVVPHQPGHRVLFKTSEILNIPLEKIVFNMGKFANTAGASIPMALDALYRQGKITSGDTIVMPAVGSGWTYGVSIIKWF